LLTDTTGVHGQNGVAMACPVPAESKVTFEYHFWPDGTVAGGIDQSHKGPCAVYMKKVNDPTTDQAVGDGWFKIFEEDYDSSTNQWCTEKYINKYGHFTVTIPSDLAGGYYLVRPELLSLHEAHQYNYPQFYVGCAQVFLESSGSSVPKDTVSIPGYVDMSKPAMTYDIYTTPLKLPFPSFSPPTYTGSSKRRVEERDTQVQTIGAKPAECEFQNNNFCGHKLAAYHDQAGCFAVRSQIMILRLCDFRLTCIIGLCGLWSTNYSMLCQRWAYRP